MKLSDYQLLTVSALVRFKKLREEVLYKARSEYFDDMGHRLVIESLKNSATKFELIQSVESLGGMAYLRKLASIAHKQVGNVSLREINGWLSTLAEEYKRFAALDIISRVEDELTSLSVGASSDPIVASMVEGLIETSTDRTSPGFRSLDEVHDEVEKALLGLLHGIVSNRTPTGFPTTDKFMGGGLMHGLITLGGEPGTGKTTFALKIAYNIAKEIEKGIKTSAVPSDPGIVAVVSAEMSMSDVILRMIQMELGISTTTTSSANPMSRSDFVRAKKFHDYLSGLPIVVDDSDMLSSTTVYSRLESLYLKYKKICLIVVDFAELIIDDGEKGNKEQQLGNVYIKSAILAKRYACPVVVISHLSRGVGFNNPSRVPSMNHLRYTKLAEALSSMVVLLYYPYGYEIIGKPVPTPTNMPSVEGTSYVILDKHRSGPTGIKPMGWEPEFTKWSDKPASGIYHTVTSEEAFNLEE